MKNNISKSIGSIAKSVSPSRANYTHQVDNPEDFLRFDLTEGICWFQDQVASWLKEVTVDTVLHYPNASILKKQDLLSQWLSIEPSRFAIGNGSDELIELIAQLFLKPGDECVTVVPSFFRFAEASVRVGAIVRTVPLQVKNRFAWTPKVVEMMLLELKRPRVKLVWLASPNNPSGVPIPEVVIDQITASGKIVVLDKVLNGFPKELQATRRLIKKNENVIVLSGFSKTFGLPGIRSGFAITSPEKAKLISDRRLPFSSSAISLFLIEKLLQALIKGEITIPTISEVTRQRLWLEKEINLLKNIEVVSSSTTNLILIKSRKNSQLFSELKRNGILTTDLNHLDGVENLGLVRISVRSQKENEKLVEVLKKMEE